VRTGLPPLEFPPCDRLSDPVGAISLAPAQPSPAALRKRASKAAADGLPVHSFQSLLRDLATCTLNEMTTTLNAAYSFTLVATPTSVQAPSLHPARHRP
jgi:hypothetical protein